MLSWNNVWATLLEHRGVSGHVGGGDGLVRVPRTAGQSRSAKLGDLGDCLQVPDLSLSSYSSSCNSSRRRRPSSLHTLHVGHPCFLRLPLRARAHRKSKVGRCHACGRSHSDGRLGVSSTGLVVIRFFFQSRHLSQINQKLMEYQVEKRFPKSASIDPESQIGYVFRVALGGEGRLAVATQDRSLRLIDTERMDIIAQIPSAHASTITDIQHVPSTEAGFISASNDGTCKVWDLRIPDPIVSIKLSNDVQDAPVFAACVSGSGTCAAACGSNISLFKYGVWKKHFEYSESHFDTVSCMQFSSLQNQSSDVLVSGGDDGMVNIYNTLDLVNEDNGQCPLVSLNVGESVRSVHYTSRDHLYVFSTSESVSVWDPSTGGKIRSDVDHVRSHPMIASDETGWGYLIDINAEGSRLLAGNSTGSLVEFDIDTFEVSSIFQHSHSGVVRTACCLPRENRWITAGEDGYLFSWNTSSSVDGSSLSRNSISRSNRSAVSTRPY